MSNLPTCYCLQHTSITYITNAYKKASGHIVEMPLSLYVWTSDLPERQYLPIFQRQNAHKQGSNDFDVHIVFAVKKWIKVWIKVDLSVVYMMFYFCWTKNNSIPNSGE